MLASTIRHATRQTALLTRHMSVETGIFPGGVEIPFTPALNFHMPEDDPRFPCFRVMDNSGKICEGSKDPGLDEDFVLNMYTHMLRIQAMDQIFYDAQRQGRISFYMTSGGEEGIHIGSAAALTLKDVIFSQYREAGVLMWRGFSLEQFADQCFSNADDLGKGRQMPVHYGSAALNFQTISSPLSTQVPQAVGAGYALRQAGEEAVAAVFFGDGSASEGDVHPAMNMAATLDSPTLFLCRNNGYAISTAVEDQYRGDGIVSRGKGYGIASLRVDGNDVFAVLQATAAAKQLALRERRPVLLEYMTYRQGHHSTSDDSTRYREMSEILEWQNNNTPIARLRGYLEDRGWWCDEQEEAARQHERREVLRALSASERKPHNAVPELFTDVYAEKPPRLQEQEVALHAHMAKYPEHYANVH